MTIAVASDLHDNQANLEKFLKWCHDNAVDKILFLGDLCDSETYKNLTTEFQGEVFLVYGNGDNYLPTAPEMLEVKLAGLKLVLIHEPDLTRKAISLYNPDYVLYGHTHKPALSEYFNMGKRVWLLNPGTLGGIYYKATFAVIREGVAELKILELL